MKCTVALVQDLLLEGDIPVGGTSNDPEIHSNLNTHPDIRIANYEMNCKANKTISNLY
ncbi:hypothetical protein RvY_18290 [Ramazzottius varieornatus]|uniref:Uncharacterized protein n=1 Tax=Ramazzottius varieornatus TaxID=947166 RepID=A0A1D1W564_RAMVA|nr:hypothetical protein RvY_18290 [Ramazzottius varieornatus]